MGISSKCLLEETNAYPNANRNNNKRKKVMHGNSANKKKKKKKKKYKQKNKSNSKKRHRNRSRKKNKEQKDVTDHIIVCELSESEMNDNEQYRDEEDTTDFELGSAMTMSPSVPIASDTIECDFCGDINDSNEVNCEQCDNALHEEEEIA